MTRYAELAVTTNFSFLRGASHPQEMVAQAGRLGLAAIGIADRNSFAGVVRAFDTWRRDKAVKLLVGTRLVTVDGFEVIAYPTDRAAYGRLCRLLTKGNVKVKKGQKGENHIAFADVVSASDRPDADRAPARARSLRPSPSASPALASAAPQRCFLAGIHLHRGDEPRRLGELDELGKSAGAPLVAVNDVLYHAPERRPLADVLTCIREKCTIDDAGLRLAVNAERHLKPPEEMAQLFAAFPEAIARTVEIADACRFSLDELKYEYPDEPVPPGRTAQEHLAHLAWEGAHKRYPRDLHPDGIPAEVQKRLVDELAIIAKLDYARYFLTVHDVVAFARNLEEPILCQGRGSAANSAVCYCLGITEVNPNESKLLFARFISENRNEPPDIDVDFEHERREEVIQYIYKRYGKDRAAICATVIHYRSKRAIREVGKAMGLTEDVTAALAKTVWGSHDDGLPDKHIREAGLDPANPQVRQAVGLARQLLGFPRHLSQHVGGFVLTRERLDETVPIGNAAMEKRTFIEWDKDDIDTLGLMKVDVLALGMLSCLKRGLDLLKVHYNKDYTLATLPKEDPAVYDMLCKADFVGVFQVESRAQMSMLPRLKPTKFYDLVIEVAIVRPGPIQGDMVHPYLRRRDGIDPEHYPSPDPAHGPPDELRNVLERTKGVPLFQEQAMQIAIEAAKFTPDEADGLRRAMATFRHNGTVHLFREKFITGMTSRGYAPGFRRALLQADRGLRRVRLPGEPRGELRAARLRLLLDQVPLPGRVLRRHSQQPAHGLLPAGPARARRAPARRRGARGRRQLQRLGLHLGARLQGEPLALRRAARLPAGPGAEPGRARAADRSARQRLCQRRAARGGCRPLTLHGGAPRRGRCLPLRRPRPAGGAVGGAADRPDWKGWGGGWQDEAASRSAGPASHSAHERRFVLRARDRASLHAAQRARGGGLRGDGPVAESPPRALLPRGACAPRHHAQRRSPQR